MSNPTIHHPIYTFSVTKLQFSYFEKLNKYLNQSNDKALYKNMNSLLFTSSVPLNKISEIVDLFIIEKKSNAKHKQKIQLFFWLYKYIKVLDAVFNYWRYCSTIKKKNINYMIMWNGLKYKQNLMKLAASKYKVKIFYMENGLIPGMTTIDNKGVNYLNSVPRSPNFFLARLSNKYSKPTICTCENKKIFIPFQVNTDSQIIKYSPWIRDMYALVKTISDHCQYLPKGYKVIFKTHPKCPEDYSELFKKFEGHSHIIFDNENPTNTLIEKSEIVLTINSTVGIEGLIQYKKVITLGDAFYNIDGLVHHAGNSKQLKEIFCSIEKLKINYYLISSFLDYMINEYQIPGSWTNPDNNHFRKIITKINKFVCQ